MNRHVVFYLLGQILLLHGLVLLVPLLSAYWWGEPGLWYFGPALLAALGLGVLFRYHGRRHKRQLEAVEGAWYMVLLWPVLGFVGMIPYLMAGLFASPVDAFLESVAAFTTTGISSLAGSGMIPPKSIFFWHSLMEWLGGLNFMLMLVSVMPQVSGCFGLTLSARQSVIFSPIVGRMQEAARQTGCIYLVITVISIVLYFLAGLPLGIAVNQGFMTVSTSGGWFNFSHYHNFWLELACMVSMLLVSCNFLLYWKGWERKEGRTLLKDMELRTFLLVFLVAGLAVSLHLWTKGVYDFGHSLRYGLFQVLSFLSSSGFASVDASTWPEFDKYLLFLLSFVGGCIGSAAGGLRVMRFIVLFKMAAQEMRRTLHPHMVIALKIDNLPVERKIISRVLSYFFLFMSVFFISLLVLSLAGITPLQAMSIAVGCLSSTGFTMTLFGLDSLAALPGWTKLYCCFLMILGRIEIFSFLIVIQTLLQSLQRRRW